MRLPNGFRLCIIICLQLICINSFAQTTNISGVINHYVKVDQLGSGSCVDSLYVTSTANFNANDTVMIIQMKGATIDTTNTAAFGSIISYGEAGNYEFGIIASTAPGVIVLKNALMRAYSPAGLVQLVRIPQYVNANVTGTLTCAPWNGNTGGILALMASGTVTLNTNVDVSGKGLRGAIAPTGSFSCNAMNYFYPSGSPHGGLKGEGIAQLDNTKLLGRGAQANGGGGGNNNNSGGGGGGNYTPGGRGGNQVLYQACTGLPIGGESGFALPVASTQNRFFLGGGGGSGHQNDNNNQGIHGMNGGGIIFISSPQIVGNNFTFMSNGFSNSQMPTTDGAGGGGAAGTIVFDVANYTGSINLNLNGGNGGNINSSAYCLGTGGGGSGGVFWHQGVTIPVNVNTTLNGGLSGTQIHMSSSCYQSTWGGANGQPGVILTNFQYTIPVIPVADAGPNQIICAGDSVQLGGVPQPGVTYNWSQGAGVSANPIVSPTQTTTYVLTVTQGTGCLVTDVDSVTITVQPSPVAGFTFTTACDGVTFDFTNTSMSGVSFTWNFGDSTSSTATSPQHIFPGIGLYQVQLVVTASSGCTDSLTVPINATTPQYPVVAITSIQSDSCSFEVIIAGDTLNTTGFNWDFGDGNSGTQLNTMHTYATPGTYTIMLIGQNLCGSDTAIATVTIQPQSIAQALFTADTTFCSPLVEFTNQSVNATLFIWFFGDGDSITQTNPSHTYTADGVYTVTLVALNNCHADTVSMQITVASFELPQASFHYSIDSCSFGAIFSNTSLYGTTFHWDFGDSTTTIIENPVHVYAAPGVYPTTLITTNACGIDTVEISVNLPVITLPVADFSYEISLCFGAAQFTDLSNDAQSWQWYFGDGGTSTQQHPIHVYKTVGVFEVMLITNVGSPCADTIVQLLEIDAGHLPVLFIPNAFTPNNDGKNDRFVISSAQYCDDVEVAIYNRWGQEVFRSKASGKTWDGSHNNTPSPAGVYFFSIRINNRMMNGYVSLIR